MAADRPLPHNLDAERAVLGAVILDNGALHTAGLCATAFFIPAHRRIFAAMQKLAAAGKPVEEIGLWELLKSDSEVQGAGGMAYIAALADGLPRASKAVGRWAAIIKEKAALRDLAHTANALSLAALDRDAEPQELQARLRQLGETVLVNGNEPRLRAVTAVELLSIEVPAREMVLAPILPTQGLVMLYSKRGVGKTHLALGIASAVSMGSRFLRWDAPKPRGVLFIDGELPASVLRHWFAEIAAGMAGSPEPAALRFLTPDLQTIPLPDLATSEGQALIEPHLTGVELVILDNLSALCRAGVENEGESWLPVQGWALQLRRRGISVLFLHHAGRDGQWARGTSRREDLLDTVVALRHPVDYSPTEGLRCEIHYEKCRAFFGEETKPFEVKMHNGLDGSAVWAMRDVEDVIALWAGELFREGMSVRDVAEELRISKSKAHRIKVKLKASQGASDEGTVPLSHCPTPL